MRKYLSLCFFLAFPAIIQAQTFECLPPARPVFNLPDTATIFIMGDVMMHSGQIANAVRPDGTYCFSGYLDYLEGRISDADLAIANMEFTLAGKPYTGYPSFSAPDGFEDYLAECGVDIFLTANNHILDKGVRGLRRTLERYSLLEKQGRMKYAGSSLNEHDDSLRFPLIVAVRGVRVALINFTYGTNHVVSHEWPNVHLDDRDGITSAIQRARRSGAQFVIALPHWGTEYVLRHSREQEDLALWLASQGCDAVVGAHPHVVQDCDSREIPIVYSLGNVISNMSARNTQLGLSVIVRIVTDEQGKHRMLAPEYLFTWCARPGSLNNGFSVVPVKDFLACRDSWINPLDHDNMVSTYQRVKTATGIID